MTPARAPARGDAQVRPLDRLAALEPRDHVADRVRRHREADPDAAARLRRDLGVDADHAPLASSSGPPELPGLIGASVWMTESIWNPSGAWMWRPVPEMMPEVVVCESPNGDPIATASWPVRTAFESASFSALSCRPGADLHDGQVDDRSTPATRPVIVSSSANCTCTVLALPTTCALVTIVPDASVTKPVPEPLPVEIDDDRVRAAA